MIVELYIALLVFGFFFLFVAGKTNSWGAAFLASFTFLVIGWLMFSYGVDIQNGETRIVDANTTTITYNYDNYAPHKDIPINLIALTCFSGGLVGLLLSSVFALKGSD